MGVGQFIERMEENIDYVSQIMVHVRQVWKFIQKYIGYYQLDWLGKKITGLKLRD